MRADLLAGLIGAILVLPQGVAFATLAGPAAAVRAVRGDGAARVVARCSGSILHLIAGPTNAVSILIFASLSPLAAPGSPDYIGLVLTVAFLTGVIELAMGLARLGALVNFVSHTVIIGFTRRRRGADRPGADQELLRHRGSRRRVVSRDPAPAASSQAGHINPYVIAVGVLTLVVAIPARRFVPKIPFMIVAMVRARCSPAG